MKPECHAANVPRRRKSSLFSSSSLHLLLFTASVPAAMAQNCIPLAGSTACPAWNRSSISTGPALTGYFPFLAFVSDTQSFDNQIRQYIATTYAQQKYQQLIGCSDIDLTNTTDLYARYTTSVLCNAIVQNSIQPCSLSAAQSRPLCASTCAQQAISEQQITSSPEICGTPGPNALGQIRADFTVCSLPADSLSGSCISGWENEPYDCGYATNLGGLCSFCAASSPNSTDSCCINSRTESRCSNVHLPITTSMPPLFPSSTSSAASRTASATASSSATNGTALASGHRGLSGGQIAGVVVGSVLGALLLLGLIIFCCVLLRRRRNRSQAGSVFNQPSPSRRGVTSPMAYADTSREPEILPGARVARMAALEGTSSSSGRHSSPIARAARRSYQRSSSDQYNDTPESQRSGLGAGPLPKRHGSLSSSSALAQAEDSSSPKSNSGNEYSSPEGVGSGHSEQLQTFKDYYSQEEIKPGDRVATLWAYQPRANDEFELERGDMLKVVGIWDDGWATGVKLSERAEDLEGTRNGNRDSGVSNGSRRPESASDRGEIKAFPLVCVCLPQHWRKTIEGENLTEAAAASGNPPSSSP